VGRDALSEHSEAIEHGHVEEHAHPSAAKYIQIAVILGIITALEVAVYYVEQIKVVLPQLLIGMSALKFGIVAAYYMHLKFDSRLFTWFFCGGLALAGSVVLAFMALGGTFIHPGYSATPGAGH
jgi:cytochrome c oxidase subunit 4